VGFHGGEHGLAEGLGFVGVGVEVVVEACYEVGGGGVGDGPEGDDDAGYSGSDQRSQ
jgi:hypothetical protein